MENTEVSVDFRPGIEGFEFADLFKPERLRDLADVFDQELAESNRELFSRWDSYRRDPASLRTAVEISALLISVSSYVSQFLTRLFGIEKETAALAVRTMN